VVFALQPFLPQKPHQTGIERRILDLTLDHPISGVLLRNGYPRIRQGLVELAGQEGPTSSTAPMSSIGSRPPPSPTCGTSAIRRHRMLAHRLIEGVAPLLAGPG